MCDKDCFKKLEDKIDDVIANIGRVSSFSHDAMTHAKVAANEVNSLSKMLDGIPKRVSAIELWMAKQQGRVEGSKATVIVGWTVVITCIGLAIAWLKK